MDSAGLTRYNKEKIDKDIAWNRNFSLASMAGSILDKAVAYKHNINMFNNVN